ncbi:Target of rapamycin complex 2 subunit avo2 [Microbotryomycetes sp. JL221]|nr:Target of rapamycin complex 2 subunit avo2 [Microbotryomycetes sp. JL221]
MQRWSAVASPKATINHLERLAARLTLDDIRNPDNRGTTSLALAAAAGNTDVVEWLLFEEAHEQGEISRDAAGDTVVHIASANGHVEILEMYLSQYPFVLDWTNSRGATALHVAAMQGQLEAAQLLIDSGADIDAPDLQGNTPLHYATSWGTLPVIKLLVEVNCDVTAKNNDGFTAAEYSFSFACLRALEEFVRVHYERSHRSKRDSRQPSTPNLPHAGTDTNTFDSASGRDNESVIDKSQLKKSPTLFATHSPGRHSERLSPDDRDGLSPTLLPTSDDSPSLEPDDSRPHTPLRRLSDRVGSSPGSQRSSKRLSLNSALAPAVIGADLSPAEFLRRRASGRDGSNSTSRRMSLDGETGFVNRPQRTSSIGALNYQSGGNFEGSLNTSLTAHPSFLRDPTTMQEASSDTSASASLSGPSAPQSTDYTPSRSRANSTAVDSVDGIPVLARPQMEIPFEDDATSAPSSRKTVRATSWSHGPQEVGPRKLRRASHSVPHGVARPNEQTEEYILQRQRSKQHGAGHHSGKLTRALGLKKKSSRD